MPSQVLMLCLQELDANDLSLLKIITFLGLKTQVIFLNDSEYTLKYLRGQNMENDVCAAINCKALSMVRESGNIEEIKYFFFSRKFCADKARFRYENAMPINRICRIEGIFFLY